MLHIERAPPILTTLNWGLGFARYHRVSDVIVGEGRLFDPRESFVVQHAQTLHGLGRCQRLVIVDHDRDGVAHRLPHGTHHREVLLHRWIADFGLDTLKAALHPVFSYS